MKITFIATLSDYWGGSEVLWVKAAELAIEQGHTVQVVVYNQNRGLHPELQNLRKHTSSFLTMPNSVAPSSYKSKVLSSVKNKIFKFSLSKVNYFNPDCVIINQVHSYSAAFNPVIYELLLNHKRPFYLISHFNSEHTVLSYSDILKARNLMDKTVRIFYVSERNIQTSERQLARHFDHALVLGNHPNINKLSLIPYPENQEKIQFASVARLEAQFKGQDILLQVLGTEKWRNRSWHLNFYGTGPDERYLKELCAFYNLRDFVTFHGHISDIKDVWKVNHALVMPSTSEGKPLALIEAMLCGRIGIVSDVAGNRELAEHGVNGFVASSYFPKPFDEALDEAWLRKTEWKAMGINGHKKIVREIDFNPQATLLKIVEQTCHKIDKSNSSL